MHTHTHTAHTHALTYPNTGYNTDLRNMRTVQSNSAASSESKAMQAAAVVSNISGSGPNSLDGIAMIEVTRERHTGAGERDNCSATPVVSIVSVPSFMSLGKGK